MGLMDKIFRRKKEEPDLGSIEMPKIEIPTEATIQTMRGGDENTRAKMDLIATHLESLKVQYETLNERISRMEKTINEIYAIAKRS